MRMDKLDSEKMLAPQHCMFSRCLAFGRRIMAARGMVKIGVPALSSDHGCVIWSSFTAAILTDDSGLIQHACSTFQSPPSTWRRKVTLLISPWLMPEGT